MIRVDDVKTDGEVFVGPDGRYLYEADLIRALLVEILELRRRLAALEKPKFRERI